MTTCVSSGPFTEEDLKEMVLRLAHEIRNPLATIKSAVQLVKRLEMSPDKAARYLDSAVNEVGRISDLLSVMEEYVRLATRQSTTVLVYLTVAEIIAEVIEKPRAEVYTRPQYREMVAGYYTAEDIAEVESRPPFLMARRS